MAVLRDFIHRWSWDDLEISHPSKEQIYRYLTLETDLDGVVSKMMELFMSLQPEIVAEMVYRRSAEFGRNKHTLQLKSPGFQFWNSPIRLANLFGPSHVLYDKYLCLLRLGYLWSTFWENVDVVAAVFFDQWCIRQIGHQWLVSTAAEGQSVFDGRQGNKVGRLMGLKYDFERLEETVIFR